MARIVVIAHTYDEVVRQNYLLNGLADCWLRAGHSVAYAVGLGDWPDGDVAVMHVDLSVISPAYLAAAARYPAIINGAATDIRKTRVSRNLVKRGDAWSGPVIVKTDLNCGGLPERRLERESAPVPDALRAERDRLGFDYGKFDFVVRDGEAVLLDANRTPGRPPAHPDIVAANARLASGLARWTR